MTCPVRREGRAASLRRLSVFSHAKGGALGRPGSIVPVLVPVLILVRGPQSGRNMSLQLSLTMN